MDKYRIHDFVSFQPKLTAVRFLLVAGRSSSSLEEVSSILTSSSASIALVGFL